MEIIKTKAYGEIEVDENTVIKFKREILGFEEYREFYLIEMLDLPNFYWLQSRNEPSLAFIVVDPRMFMKDYTLNIDDADRELLEIEEGDEIIDLAIVNIPEDIHKMTMNLLGPIVINAKKRIAIQAISLNENYGTKIPLFNYNNEYSANNQNE